MAVVKRAFRINALTAEQRRDIVARYSKASASEVAKEYGTTPATILRILRQESATIRPRGFTLSGDARFAIDGSSIKERVEQLQAKGLNGPQIARELNVSLAFIYKHFSFKDPATHQHHAALVEIRETLVGVMDKQARSGTVSSKLKRQIAAMDFVLSIKLPRWTKAVDSGEPKEIE